MMNIPLISVVRQLKNNDVYLTPAGHAWVKIFPSLGLSGNTCIAWLSDLVLSADEIGI